MYKARIERLEQRARHGQGTQVASSLWVSYDGEWAECDGDLRRVSDLVASNTAVTVIYEQVIAAACDA